MLWPLLEVSPPPLLLLPLSVLPPEPLGVGLVPGKSLLVLPEDPWKSIEGSVSQLDGACGTAAHTSKLMQRQRN